MSSNRHRTSGQTSPQNVPPRAGQYVKISGREEIYVILRIDKSRHLADLLREGSVRKVESGVPLALLHAIQPSSAIDELQRTEQAS